MEIVVRPCSIDDVAILDKKFPLEGGHSGMAQAQADGAGAYLLALADGEIVGHVMIRFAGSLHQGVRDVHPEVPEIGRLYVQPEYRRLGVGRALLEVAEATSVDKGFVQVGLAVGVRNAAAIELYEAVGYNRCAQIQTFQSPYGVDDRGELHTHVVTYMTKSLRMLAAI